MLKIEGNWKDAGKIPAHLHGVYGRMEDGARKTNGAPGNSPMSFFVLCFPPEVR